LGYLSQWGIGLEQYPSHIMGVSYMILLKKKIDTYLKGLWYDTGMICIRYGYVNKNGVSLHCMKTLLIKIFFLLLIGKLHNHQDFILTSLL